MNETKLKNEKSEQVTSYAPAPEKMPNENVTTGFVEALPDERPVLQTLKQTMPFTDGQGMVRPFSVPGGVESKIKLPEDINGIKDLIT